VYVVVVLVDIGETIVVQAMVPPLPHNNIPAVDTAEAAATRYFMFREMDRDPQVFLFVKNGVRSFGYDWIL
jgi:hypothetical protein